MVATALKEKAMDYFTALDDERAELVISYMEAMERPSAKKKNLADLKGKIQFADGYDYKSMRSAR